jgi:hypothetical protein
MRCTSPAPRTLARLSVRILKCPASSAEERAEIETQRSVITARTHLPNEVLGLLDLPVLMHPAPPSTPPVIDIQDRFAPLPIAAQNQEAIDRSQILDDAPD